MVFGCGKKEHKDSHTHTVPKISCCMLEILVLMSSVVPNHHLKGFFGDFGVHVTFSY